jgi:glycosyltransferase involved in cell wall biosynthesis
MEISVIIPAKNEAGSVGDVVQGILSCLGDVEVIVVNDGSSDMTADVAASAGARVISHPYSKGNGSAIKTGARAAAGDVLVFMDGDGQHSASEIPRFLEALGNGADMVVGARSEGSQASLGRGLANKFYNWLSSWMSGTKIKDLTSGFRAVKAKKFRQFLYLLPNGFSYPTTSTMAFLRAGYSVEFIPIDAAKRLGKSHIKPVKDGIRFLLIIFKIGTLYSPLKLFVPIAFALFLVGISYYGYTFSTQGRFTNMSALLLSTSLIIFLVGLVSEQITALMYRETDQEKD